MSSSIPIFKDFDESAKDIFDKDFDKKYSLKIKAPAPHGVVITTNTTFDKGLSSKISGKYSYNSTGFTVEKLEYNSKGNFSVETSLSGVAPGLKLEFKANDDSKGDLSATYKSPAFPVTLTGEVDAISLKKASASVCGGHGAFSAGANVDLNIEKPSCEKFNFGFGYAANKLFAGIRVNNNISDYSALLSYGVADKLSLAGSAELKASASPTFSVAGVYNCNPNTLVKIKASSAGVIDASVKQTIDKKFFVVGSASLPSGLTDVQFGLNATLG